MHPAAGACVRASPAGRGSARAHPPPHRPRDHRGQSRPRAGRSRRHPHARCLRRPAAANADRGVRGHGGRARHARHHLLPRRRPGARPRGAAPSAADRARDAPRLPARGEDLHPRRRRPLHRPHDPRRDRGALRLRPASGASSSRSSATADTASSRSAPTTSARTCPPRAPSASRCSSSRWTRSTRSCSSPLPRRNRTMSDITVVRDELPPAQTDAPAPASRSRTSPATTSSGCSRRRATSRTPLDRELKKLPTLRGRTVVNLFYESSTRTSSSFELAAKRLSADVMSIKAVGLGGRQGRVAEGHGADARRLRPGRDRHPPPSTSARRSSSRA